MAGQKTNFQMAYKVAAGNKNPDTDLNEIPRYRFVEQAGEGEIKLPTADNAVILGAVTNDERLADPLRGGGGSQAGKHVAVQLDQIASVELDGVVAVGGRVIGAVGGKGKAMPAAKGQYNVVGFAEKGGIKGDVVPVRLAYHVWTIEA